MAQFAVIAWGSLLWDPQDCEPYGMTPYGWHREGPVFPLEFSYISRNRLGALTLVIDGEGALCETYWIPLDMKHWPRVLERLKQREGRVDWVGRGKPRPTHQPAAQVYDWLMQHPTLERALWTSQFSNFDAVVQEPFSVENGLDYVAGLERTAFESAREYVHRTPAQTQTPFRLAFETRWPPA